MPAQIPPEDLPAAPPMIISESATHIVVALELPKAPACGLPALL
jgi:hypothetical protein